MFEKLCGDIFIDMVFARELDRDPHQVKRKHSHPTGAIALLEMTSIEETGVAVEHADVVEPEKSALENVVVFGVLAIHPPGKGDEHFVENSFEKRAVALAGLFPLDRRGRLGRIAIEPLRDDVLIKLFVPKQSTERLPLDRAVLFV